MNKRYIIAIDEGTTSVRTVLFDVKEHKIIKSVSKSFEQIYPRSGWVEHNASEILKATKWTFNQIIKDLNLKQVYGVGITNQRETVVAWDKKTGKPVYNAIVWQCRRTSEYCKKQLVGRKASLIRKLTGLVPDAYFSATKIQWLFQKVPEIKQLASKNELCVGTIESFLAFNLSCENCFVTDASNASRTMLYNIHTNQWDEKLLKLFDIPLSVLPKIVDNDEIVGHILIDDFKIPIAGLIGDQQSSLFGQCCFKTGDVKNTCGTGSFMLMNLGDKVKFSKNKLVTTVAWRRNGKTTYALEGSVFNSGSCITWLIENLKSIKSPSETDKIAEQVSDTDNTFFVPAFTGLGAPYWCGDARAMFFGISRNTNYKHLTRAVLESIAYRVKDIYDIMQKDTGNNTKVVRFDGGVSQSDFIMQLLSNLFGQTIDKSLEKESTALGAIYMCGLANGAWKNCDELNKLYKIDKSFKSNDNSLENLKNYNKWKKIVLKAIK